MATTTQHSQNSSSQIIRMIAPHHQPRQLGTVGDKRALREEHDPPGVDFTEIRRFTEGIARFLSACRLRTLSSMACRGGERDSGVANPYVLPCWPATTSEYQLPANTNEYQRVPTTTKEYQRLSASTTNYQRLPATISGYQQLPKSTNENPKLSQSTPSYPKLPQYMKIIERRILIWMPIQ